MYSVKSSFGYAPEAFGSETYDLELAYQRKHKIGEINPFAANTKLHDQAGHGQQVQYQLPDKSQIVMDKQ